MHLEKQSDLIATTALVPRRRSNAGAIGFCLFRNSRAAQHRADLRADNGISFFATHPPHERANMPLSVASAPRFAHDPVKFAPLSESYRKIAGFSTRGRVCVLVLDGRLPAFFHS
jgi:hypothetical protein